MQNEENLLIKIKREVQKHFPDLMFKERDFNVAEKGNPVFKIKMLYVDGCSSPFCMFNFEKLSNDNTQYVKVFFNESIPEGHICEKKDPNLKYTIASLEEIGFSLYKEHVNYELGEHKSWNTNLNSIIEGICNHLQEQRDKFHF